jgi:hypothetical protein
MKPERETTLICVNAILQLKLGIVVDLFAAGSSSGDGRYCRHCCVGLRFMLSASPQTPGTASV